LRKRARKVIIDPYTFFQILRTGTMWKVERGVPDGAEYLGLMKEPGTENLILFLEHPSFDEIEVEKEIAPKLTMLFKKVN